MEVLKARNKKRTYLYINNIFVNKDLNSFFSITQVGNPIFCEPDPYLFYLG